jgi:aspartokinase-like uncharacterized kinase
MGLSVIKVGGSLATQPIKLRALCKKLSELSKRYSLVVVPGGGEFADVVRQLDARFQLSRQASHRMAILGMDQYGLLLSDLITDSVAVDRLENARKAIEEHKLPILLPSRLLFRKDPLENSWDVTSDSIALYIAHRLHADRALLITDVDGIYTRDPKQEKNAKLIQNITPNALLALDQRTSVDKALPKLLLQWRVNCYVINGLFPDRVEDVLGGQKPLGTHISTNHLSVSNPIKA